MEFLWKGSVMEDNITVNTKTKQKKAKTRKRTETNWQKLDNTANLFPAIATHTMTNVYRIAVELDEEIDRDMLQKALDMVLPGFGT